MEKKRKSVFKGYSAYSYWVEWDGVKFKGQIETLNKDQAMRLCADLKRQYKTKCLKIDCATGDILKKIA